MTLHELSASQWRGLRTALVTRAEAYDLLDNAPSGAYPSKLNPRISQELAISILRMAVSTFRSPNGKPPNPKSKIKTKIARNVRIVTTHEVVQE